MAAAAGGPTSRDPGRWGSALDLLFFGDGGVRHLRWPNIIPWGLEAVVYFAPTPSRDALLRPHHMGSGAAALGMAAKTSSYLEVDELVGI
jgi:hypothetical protein